MTQALFTSRHSGPALKQHILDRIAAAGRLDGGVRELQVMCFALTDADVAQALIDLAHAQPDLIVRVLADWSQAGRSGASLLPRIGDEAPRNLFVKFKLDLPYEKGPSGAMRYAYRASLGLLHHKTLCLLSDGRPISLTLGSMNWSKRALVAYENLITLDTVDHPGEQRVRQSFADEFDAFWKDHGLSAAQGRVERIRQQYLADRQIGLAEARAPADYFGTSHAERDPPRQARRLEDCSLVAAFSGALPSSGVTTGGFAPLNDRRALSLRRPSGGERPAPLSLTTLSLQAIRSIPPDASARLAMYALSPRTAEYGALLDAARRGVRIDVILDGRIGSATATALRVRARREGLALRVKTTRRRMHQKYLCCPETGLVLTGTANMTVDAEARHADHRLLIQSDISLCASFNKDFEKMWARLPDASAVPMEAEPAL